MHSWTNGVNSYSDRTIYYTYFRVKKVKEIHASPCAPLAKSELLMHYCVVSEASTLTTTLSVETWYEAWSRSSTDGVIGMAFSLDGVIQLSVK